MIKIILGISVLSAFSFAGNLSYISSDGGIVRNEKVKTVLVQNGLKPHMTVYSKTISCELNFENMKEALQVQKDLIQKNSVQTWLQCLGAATQKNKFLLVSADKYIVGKMVD